MSYAYIDCIWNVMAHAQKPDFVFLQSGRVHSDQREPQFSPTTCSRCARISGSNAGYTTFWGSFPFTFPRMRHHVPSHFNWSLLHFALGLPWSFRHCNGLYSPYRKSFSFCKKNEVNRKLQRVRISLDLKYAYRTMGNIQVKTHIENWVLFWNE